MEFHYYLGLCAHQYITHSDTYLYAAPIIGVLLMIKLMSMILKLKDNIKMLLMIITIIFISCDNKRREKHF
jgi:hypothetical protein